MRVYYGGAVPAAAKKNRQERQQQTKTVSTARVTRINGERISFRDLARFAWPTKTEFILAELTGYDPRTCLRWLGEHTEPPADALGVVLGEIMRRFHQRTE